MKEINPDKWAEGKVIELHQWSDTLYSVRVEADTQLFIAGQFTKLGLPIDDEFIERPYSFVNSPQNNVLEFYFVTVESGSLTEGLILLKPGDALWVMKKPSGFLTLNEVPEAKHLWLISTGTGIGPFLSMLGTDEPWGRFDRVTLIHAVGHQVELSYTDLINQFKEQHADQFQFVAFVSREPCEYALSGRIPAAIDEGTLETLTGIEIGKEASQVMICGNPAMVKDTSNCLQARGLERNRRRTPGHITIENYW